MSDADIQAIISQHKEMMETYQKVMDEKVQQYDAMVRNAQQQMAALVAASQPPPQRKPESQWVESAEGERHLVLNKEAAEFFGEIFEMVGKLATALAKTAKK